jgi:hypothetical protein
LEGFHSHYTCLDIAAGLGDAASVIDARSIPS